MPMEGSREGVFLTLLSCKAISKRKHHLYTGIENMMETKLARISQLSKENPDMVYEEMMGFRPGKGCHMAIRKLNGYIENCPTNYVLDADIKGFFNHLDHEWVIRFIEAKIKDPNIIRLVRRTLKSGIIEDYQFESTEEGAGQGSVCSPVIANVYMHYVLLWWFKEIIRPKLKGFAGLVVYADDFVVCFQYKEDAEFFYRHLIKRMGHFGLEMEESKSRLIKFGRYAQKEAQMAGKKAETFDFLGFTHYCSTSRNGKFRVKRKTSRKKQNSGGI